jgi:hypothetical protein
MSLTKEQVVEAFMNIQLEENYNFLEEDLVMLADAFVKKATPEIVKAEREACVDVARAYNTLVADKILEVRSQA